MDPLLFVVAVSVALLKEKMERGKTPAPEVRTGPIGRRVREVPCEIEEFPEYGAAQRNGRDRS